MLSKEDREKLNQIAGMILAMPYSGCAVLIKLDMTKAADAEIINEIFHNLQVVNALARNGEDKQIAELRRLRRIADDVIAMRRLLNP